MCYFIEVAIPKVHESLIELNSKSEIEVYRNRTTELEKHLPNGFVAFTLLGPGGCSCDLYTGPRVKPRDTDKEHRKYKQKGWSEAKIQRALKDQERHQSSFRADAKLVLDTLSRRVERFYVLCHWSDDQLKETRNISKTTFLEETTPVLENEIVLVG